MFRMQAMIYSFITGQKKRRKIYLGEKGVLSEEGTCRIIVDMTTSSPSLAKELHNEASKKGIASLDAPVSGGDIGAKNGTLAIMVGGDKEVLDEINPLFQCMGQNIAYMGGPGMGQHTKMCNQILVAGTMIGVCESLLYAAKQGMDETRVIDIIGKGAASSWLINNLGPRIAKKNYEPGFYVEHFIKDMGIALKEAEASNLSLPGLALLHQLYVSVKALGYGRSGTQALILALKEMNGMQ
jgi:3-hydroxyisobutyrate dehydrogenase